jgi:glutathione S-transferase
MKLYYAPGACSLAPHIVARKVALELTLVKVDTGTHLTGQGVDFYTINSKGAVPVLELDNGERLTEGPVIVQYLADLARNRELMPEAGSIARYRVMEWQNYISSELHKSFSPLFGTELDATAKTALRALLRKKFEWLDAQLASKDYLTGSHFTGADAYLFTVTNWAQHAALDISDLATVQSYSSRVAALPAVQEAMRAEGLVA